MTRAIYSCIKFLSRCANRVMSCFRVSLLAKHGRGCRIEDGCHITYQNILMGNRSSIGSRCMLLSTRAKILIGDDVMIAPQVTMITGSHRIDIEGRPMNSVRDDEKLPENDQDIVLEGDNWICSNSTILKGVTIGKGAVVMAGAVVSKSIPPYEVWGGVPAKKVRNRFREEL